MNKPMMDLEGLLPQHVIVSEAENATRAFHAVRKVVKEQGQVMSAALENNGSLWETNKKLRRDIADVTATSQRLERERNHFKGLLDAIPAEMQERLLLLGENNEVKHQNEMLLRANAELRELLIRTVTPELDSDQRQAKLEQMKAQQAELLATGLVPTQEEIDARDRALSGGLDNSDSLVQH
jgi:hypothetical protein